MKANSNSTARLAATPLLLSATGVSANTISFHVRSIYDKLQVHLKARR